MGLGLLAIAAVATACGSSAPSAGHPASPEQSGGTVAPGAGSTGSGTANARQLVVVGSDLPAPWAKATADNRGWDAVRDAMSQCLAKAPGVSSPVSTATSATFVDPTNGQMVGSQAQIYSTDSQASTAAKGAGSDGVSSCLKEEVTAALPKTLPAGETLRRVQVSPNAAPGQLVGEFSQRVVAFVTYSTGNGGTGGTTTFTDILGAQGGPAVVEAQVQSTGSPPSASLERHLLGVLKARALNTRA